MFAGMLFGGVGTHFGGVVRFVFCCGVCFSFGTNVTRGLRTSSGGGLEAARQAVPGTPYVVVGTGGTGFETAPPAPASTNGGVLHRGGPREALCGLAFGTLTGNDNPGGTPTLVAGGMPILTSVAMIISFENQKSSRACPN